MSTVVFTKHFAHNVYITSLHNTDLSMYWGPSDLWTSAGSLLVPTQSLAPQSYSPVPSPSTNRYTGSVPTPQPPDGPSVAPHSHHHHQVCTPL